MHEMISSFPSQLQQQYNSLLSYEFDLNRYNSINSVIIVGMGGSAISGDIVNNFVKNDIKVPLFVVRDYSLPNWINNESLIIFSSYSGNTEETLSAYNQAIKFSKKIITITTGGALKEKSKHDQIPCIPVPQGYQPRAALGYSIMSLLMLFRKLELTDSKVSNLTNESSIELVKFSNEYCKEGQYANEIANQIKDSIISIYGIQSSTDTIASRFRSQLAENSKILTSHHILPELNHNEIEGWNEHQFKDIPKNIIWLSDKDIHKRVQKRIDVTSKLLSEIGINNIFISCDGEHQITRLLKLILLTDWISYYLAVSYSIDPMPVNRIINLKEQL